ncbi:hypothetical protein ABW19_dt0208339 [Dactylella cylindrospora]|nr:hypothetical protein ABW19_dt0208339 [Dactylella cylindrospora]
MSRLLLLPEELLEQTISYVKSPIDLRNVALTCRTLCSIAAPFRHQTLRLTFPTEKHPLRWEIEKISSRLSETWLHFLKHLEIGHRREYPKQYPSKGSSTNPFSFDDDFMPLDAEIDAMDLFNGFLRNLLRELKPMQLQSFRYMRKLICIPPLTVSSETFSVISNRQSLLTKLEIELDQVTASDCTIFYFPQLRILNFKAAGAEEVYHCLFSLLHSCQETLQFFHIDNTSFFNPFDDEESLFFEGSYRKWVACPKCSQHPSDDTKSIQMKRVKEWRCGETDREQFYGFFRKSGIMDLVELSRFRAEFGGTVLDLICEKPTMTARPLFECLEHLSRNGDELYQLLVSFSGLEMFSLLKFYTSGRVTKLLEGLFHHSDSLREVYLAINDKMFSRSELQDFGNGCRNVELLSIDMEEGQQGYLDCIFNRNIFPKLKYFHDVAGVAYIVSSRVPRASISVKLAMQGALEVNATNGTLSETIELVCFAVTRHEFMGNVIAGDAVLVEREPNVEVNNGTVLCAVPGRLRARKIATAVEYEEALRKLGLILTTRYLFPIPRDQ